MIPTNGKDCWLWPVGSLAFLIFFLFVLRDRKVEGDWKNPLGRCLSLVMAGGPLWNNSVYGMRVTSVPSLL